MDERVAKILKNLGIELRLEEDREIFYVDRKWRGVADRPVKYNLLKKFCVENGLITFPLNILTANGVRYVAIGQLSEQWLKFENRPEPMLYSEYMRGSHWTEYPTRADMEAAVLREYEAEYGRFE